MQEIPTLYPTESEFADPIEYLSRSQSSRMGRKYGMVKIVPPPAFKPPLSLNQDTFKFKVRIQKLSELNLLNRCRLFFMKQLNNYYLSKNVKLLESPYIDLKGQKLYFYDLFIALVKRVASNGKGNGFKKEDGLSFWCSLRNDCLLALPSASVVSADKLLWNHMSQQFRIPAKTLHKVFTHYIKGYYSFLHNVGAQSGVERYSKLLPTDTDPVSLISDDDDDEEVWNLSDSSLGESEDVCAICEKLIQDPNSLAQCDSCRKLYHRECIPPSATESDTFICEQCILGNGYYGFKEPERLYTLPEFKAYCKAQDKKFHTASMSQEQLESKFWEYVNDINSSVVTKYGADIHNTAPGEITGFPQSDYIPSTIKGAALDDYLEYAKHPMNLINLPTSKGSLLPLFGKKISGMTVPWIYVGSTFSTFCWHLEDQYTLSANYQHEGAPKIWYSIPEDSTNNFRKYMYELAPDLFDKQPDLLHQLVTLVSPYDPEFQKAGINCYKAVQQPNEYIVTFPRCYHAGYNSGYNLNEAVNFTLNTWVPYGLEALSDYRSTKKQCVFDIYGLLENILRKYLTKDNTGYGFNLDAATARTSYTALLRHSNMIQKFINLLPAYGDIQTYTYGKGPVHHDTDDDDDEIYCSKCKTICSMAFIVHNVITSSRKRRRKVSSALSMKQLNGLANNGKVEIYCLEDYLTILEESGGNVAGSTGNDMVYYVKDVEEINKLLKEAGTLIDSGVR